MSAYVVTVLFPDPLIGTDRVEVEANTHNHASLIAQTLRKTRRWPLDSSYFPRLRDDSTFDPSSVSTDWALFGALPALRY